MPAEPMTPTSSMIRDMSSRFAELASQGHWDRALLAVEQEPASVNAYAGPAHHTPLQMAACHGAPIHVIGALLRLGADAHQTVADTRLTAQDLAAERHPEREDLRYILTPRRLSIAQLLRSVARELEGRFGPYDGNLLVCDRLIDCFEGDAYMQGKLDLVPRLSSAIRAIVGIDLESGSRAHCGPGDGFDMEFDAAFWSGVFIPRMVDRARNRTVTPVTPEWATVSDLFDPMPRQWGLRGDLFMWLEMRQVLAHVPLPADPGDLFSTLRGAYAVIAGQPPGPEDVPVARFARGGISSGLVCGTQWNERLFPLLLQRAAWLHEAAKFPAGPSAAG